MSGSTSPPHLPASDESCPFCSISRTYPPSSPPTSSSQEHRPDLCSSLVSPPAFLVLHSSPVCMAFLDIMPLSQGHLLLTTRAHHEKVSEVTDEEARELGRWLRVLSRVLTRVTGVWDWNIVQNNGAAAAQVIPHIHFHIIPRPALPPELRNRSFTMFGRGERSELNEDEAEALAAKLRVELEIELAKENGEKGKL